MAGHLLATVNPSAAEAERGAAPADGWQPAGPPLLDPDGNPPSGEHPPSGDERLRDAIGALSNTAMLGSSDAPPRAATAIPSIGHIVVYHLRDGDSRNRRTKFPAIVMDADPETGLLKLWVIVDDGDTWMQDRVPARAAPEPGWTLVEPMVVSPMVADANLSSRLDSIDRTIEVLGKGGGVPFGLTTQVNGFESRIAALEAKRPPGRPKGS